MSAQYVKAVLKCSEIKCDIFSYHYHDWYQQQISKPSWISLAEVLCHVYYDSYISAAFQILGIKTDWTTFSLLLHSVIIYKSMLLQPTGLWWGMMIAFNLSYV